MKKGFLIKNNLKIKIFNPKAWSKVLMSELFSEGKTAGNPVQIEDFKVIFPNNTVIWLSSDK